jgi:hypothetical protein
LKSGVGKNELTPGGGKINGLIDIDVRFIKQNL